MSSRALRKLQREQEKEQQLDALRQGGPDEELEQEEESEAELLAPRKLNAFDILNQDNGAEEKDSDSVHSSEPNDAEPSSSVTKENAPPAGSSKAKGKTKGRNKRKGKKNKNDTPDTGSRAQRTVVAKTGSRLDDIDDIDIALKSLSVKSGQSTGDTQARQLEDDYQEMCRILSINTKYLNALNEMKRLFGNVVLEGENEGAGAPNAGRRRGRGPQQLDLGGALAGRNSPVSRGQGLAGLALRRNVFMLGKEEWPKATGGGLGMEVEHKDDLGTVTYRFVHNSAYQDVQTQFESCVESMDPQRMFQLLQFNPYHISALLQVSEIAKQQGDHSVSGDLLERALFSFGRSVHSSFSTALSEGKARLNFRRPENREFWLASWRYINNLGQRGTWRTTYEWAKLLLILDPERDPYSIRLILDQVALRGGQAEHFLSLTKRSSPHWITTWNMSANVQTSSALAEYKLKHPEAARSSLRNAITNFPWLFTRLFQELNVGHIPKAIWGKVARTDRERFESEIYVTRAKDLWNTPEAISFLVEVAESLDDARGGPLRDDPITLNEARHVLLSDVPSLIALLPRNFTTMQTSAADPLPPPDNEPSYSAVSPIIHRSLSATPVPLRQAGAENPPRIFTETERQAIREYRELLDFFAHIVELIGNEGALADRPARDHTTEDILAAIERSGVPLELVEQRGARMLELQQMLEALHESDADSGDDVEAPGRMETDETVG
ncbi:Transcription factor 25 [Lasallia pustulata]|uniref:Transcription factor 25 n=1 Tax=Lasallia pustulata TaxID=136370 RepID=A0A1W5DCH2_9LECA|nr:Transcription factor 25 [Lasallia pustulata]